MPKFKVHLSFRYTYDTEVEAESREEAEAKAIDESEPQYDAWLDSRIQEIKP